MSFVIIIGVQFNNVDSKKDIKIEIKSPYKIQSTVDIYNNKNTIDKTTYR